MPVLILLFLTAGVTYGVTTRVITKASDVPDMMAEAMRALAGYVVFIFIAAQMIAVFEWSELGTLIAVNLAHGLEAVGMTGFGAVLGLVLIALLSLEPGFIQAAYRIGDSTTQLIPPAQPVPHRAARLRPAVRPEPEVRGADRENGGVRSRALARVGADPRAVLLTRGASRSGHARPPVELSTSDA